MITPATIESQRLQVKCLAIENFRTFRERVVIAFEPQVTVFHGATGSGKSTALVALDVFFRAASFLLSQAPGTKASLVWSQNVTLLGRAPEPLIAERDRPSSSAPTILSATFGHDPAAWVTIRFEPTGPNFDLSLEWMRDRVPPSRRDLTQLLFTFGATTRPFALLDARRRPRWVSGQASAPLLAPSLSRELYALRTSKVAADRERWRSFAAILGDFPTLRGATISIEAGETPELVIEHPGRIVLGIDELSSGEQELASLTAALLLARAPIVAIEEPEMGLDVRTQELWKTVCAKQLAAGFVHQLVFESHQPTFDGPRVVRFRRGGDGYTVVDQAETVGGSALQNAATQRGAQEIFVTADGYTRLPESMRNEMALGEKGGRVWFLPGVDTWEAWPEQKLEELLKEKPG